MTTGKHQARSKHGTDTGPTRHKREGHSSSQFQADAWENGKERWWEGGGGEVVEGGREGGRHIKRRQHSQTLPRKSDETRAEEPGWALTQANRAVPGISHIPSDFLPFVRWQQSRCTTWTDAGLFCTGVVFVSSTVLRSHASQPKKLDDDNKTQEARTRTACRLCTRTNARTQT